MDTGAGAGIAAREREIIPRPKTSAISMNTPSNDLRARLRELLQVPERDRTDAQWDAIVEIEIELGPGKAALAAQERSIARTQVKPTTGTNAGKGDKPRKAFHKKGPKRPNKVPSVVSQ